MAGLLENTCWQVVVDHSPHKLFMTADYIPYVSRHSQNEDELRFGVCDEVLYGTKTPAVEGAQWTGIVTSIAMKMLESGAVDAVVCVQSDPNDRYGVAKNLLCFMLLITIAVL